MNLSSATYKCFYLISLSLNFHIYEMARMIAALPIITKLL